MERRFHQWREEGWLEDLMPCPTEAECQQQLWPLLLGAVPPTLHMHTPTPTPGPRPQPRLGGLCRSGAGSRGPAHGGEYPVRGRREDIMSLASHSQGEAEGRMTHFQSGVAVTGTASHGQSAYTCQS